MPGIFGDVAAVLAVAVFLATLNKALLDLVAAPLRRRNPQLDLWWFDYLALATGMLLAWIFNVNLLAALGGGEPARIAGLILTGLVIGGGTGLVNVLFAGVQGRAASSGRGLVQSDMAPGVVVHRQNVAGW